MIRAQAGVRGVHFSRPAGSPPAEDLPRVVMEAPDVILDNERKRGRGRIAHIAGVGEGRRIDVCDHVPICADFCIRTIRWLL